MAHRAKLGGSVAQGGQFAALDIHLHEVEVRQAFDVVEPRGVDGLFTLDLSQPLEAVEEGKGDRPTAGKSEVMPDCGAADI